MSFTPNEENESVIRQLYPDETQYNEFIRKIADTFPTNCNDADFQSKLHGILIDIRNNTEEIETMDSIIEKLNAKKGGRRRSSKKRPTARRGRSSNARKARATRRK